MIQNKVLKKDDYCFYCLYDYNKPKEENKNSLILSDQQGKKNYHLCVSCKIKSKSCANSIEECHQKRIEQNNQCKICCSIFSDSVKITYDVDPKTNKLKSFVCVKCKIRMSTFIKSQDVFLNVLKYEQENGKEISTFCYENLKELYKLIQPNNNVEVAKKENQSTNNKIVVEDKNCYFCVYDYNQSEEENDIIWSKTALKAENTVFCSKCNVKNKTLKHRNKSDLVEFHQTRISQANCCKMCKNNLSAVIICAKNVTNSNKINLLCNTCITHLGFFVNNVEKLLKILNYISTFDPKITIEHQLKFQQLCEIISEKSVIKKRKVQVTKQGNDKNDDDECFYCIYDYSQSEETNIEIWKKKIGKEKDNFRKWGMLGSYRLCKRCRTKQKNFKAYHKVDLLFLHQKRINQCEICGCDLQKHYLVHLDHNHKTQKTRSVLCKDCNVQLGMFTSLKDKSTLFMDYLSKHDTNITTKDKTDLNRVLEKIYEPTNNETRKKQKKNQE